MSNEKRNVETEVVKEARELTEEELEQVTGGFWGLVEIPEDKSGI